MPARGTTARRHKSRTAGGAGDRYPKSHHDEDERYDDQVSDRDQIADDDQGRVTDEEETYGEDVHDEGDEPYDDEDDYDREDELASDGQGEPASHGEGEPAGDEDAETSQPERRRHPDGRVASAAAAAQAALSQIPKLTGRQAEGITMVEPAEDSWIVGVEVVEDRRVPSAADILAIYEAHVGSDGELISYRRMRRYPRGRGDEDGGI